MTHRLLEDEKKETYRSTRDKQEVVLFLSSLTKEQVGKSLICTRTPPIRGPINSLYNYDIVVMLKKYSVKVSYVYLKIQSSHPSDIENVDTPDTTLVRTGFSSFG